MRKAATDGMRTATILDILHRGANGQRPPGIAADMHLPEGVTRGVLITAGYPDLQKVAAYRDTYLREDNREVWAAGETIEAYAACVRLNPGWIHAATGELGLEEMRLLLTVAVAMLAPGVKAADALAWVEAQEGSEAVA